MIVYAESNFVFELAFLREEFEHAERLLELSEGGRIRLAVPAFSLGEPYESLVRRAKSRQAIQDQLAVEIEELTRSRPYSDLAETSRAVTSILAQSAQEEKLRLGNVVARLVRGADVIPMTREVVASSLTFQTSMGLSPQDAIVFASVDDHLHGAPPGPKVFVNRNRKDFLTPDVAGRLAQAECKLITSFADARGYVEHVLGSAR